MKTVVTIPWNAVVPGGPPSQAKAPLLPLVVAQSCQVSSNGRASLRASRGSRSDPTENGSGGASPSLLATQLRIEEALRDPIAMISRSTDSALIELPIPDQGIVTIL